MTTFAAYVKKHGAPRGRFTLHYDRHGEADWIVTIRLAGQRVALPTKCVEICVPVTTRFRPRARKGHPKAVIAGVGYVYYTSAHTIIS